MHKNPLGWASCVSNKSMCVILAEGSSQFHPKFSVVKWVIPTFSLFSSLPPILKHGFLTALDFSVLVHCGLQIITPPFSGLVDYKEPSWSLILNIHQGFPQRAHLLLGSHKMPFCSRWNGSRWAAYRIIHLKMKSSIKTLQLCVISSLAWDCQSHFSQRAHQR